MPAGGGLGEASIGMTAGRGIEGARQAEWRGLVVSLTEMMQHLVTTVAIKVSPEVLSDVVSRTERPWVLDGRLHRDGFPGLRGANTSKWRKGGGSMTNLSSCHSPVAFSGSALL